MRTVKMEMPDVGGMAKIGFDQHTITLKVGRRTGTMSWETFFAHASLAPNPKAKAYGSARSVKQWLSEGRIRREKKGERP